MFIPRGHWHLTKSIPGTESLHLAIGVREREVMLEGDDDSIEKSMYFGGPPEKGSIWTPQSQKCNGERAPSLKTLYLDTSL